MGEEEEEGERPVGEAAYRVMETLVEHAVTTSRGQIALMVKEKMMSLSDEEIRRQIESRTRTHLDWIRVNGGIFGAFFGALFGLLNYVVTHSAALLALVR